ncbi:MAG: 5-formyltetrahydrofolate cyclo-ligase [Anaplasma sp.]
MAYAVTGEAMLAQAKTRLRDQYRKLRKDVQNRSEAGDMLRENCTRSVNIKQGAIVAGYLPRDGEIDVLPVMRHIKNSGGTVLVPVVEKGNRLLNFQIWGANGQGEYLIPEILFVPLVAFDKKLNRLGFGGGYYDYTISSLRQNHQCYCIGVAYSVQLCNEIPVAGHDQRLDLVITEDAVYG